MKPIILLSATFLLSFLNIDISGQHRSVATVQPVECSVSMDSKTIFYVWENGAFKESILTREPELIGGKEMMDMLIKLNIRYPEKAKAMKIGGTVIISVVIDTEGQIDEAFVSQGVGGGCNDEALRAVKLMDKVGFEPGEINGRPVMVKFDIPITFLPQ